MEEVLVQVDVVDQVVEEVEGKLLLWCHDLETVYKLITLYVISLIFLKKNYIIIVVVEVEETADVEEAVETEVVGKCAESYSLAINTTSLLV